jgi:hypothetical protein
MNQNSNRYPYFDLSSEDSGDNVENGSTKVWKLEDLKNKFYNYLQNDPNHLVISLRLRPQWPRPENFNFIMYKRLGLGRTQIPDSYYVSAYPIWSYTEFRPIRVTDLWTNFINSLNAYLEQYYPQSKQEILNAFLPVPAQAPATQPEPVPEPESAPEPETGIINTISSYLPSFMCRGTRCRRRGGRRHRKTKNRLSKRRTGRSKHRV